MDTDTTTIYHVKTPHFEGPFELLLELVEKRKLFINEISLASVTEEYLSHIRSNQYAPEEATVFIVIAATLVLIKSRSLLPSLSLTENEETSIKNLEHRLGLYQYISSHIPKVKELYGTRRMYFAPERKIHRGPTFTPDSAITADTMRKLAFELVHSIPKAVPKNPEVTMERVMTLEQMIDTLSDRITKEINVSFRTLSGAGRQNLTHEERVTVIVSFLAMLELVRNGLIDAVQQGQFEDIALSRSEQDHGNEENE